MLTGLRKRLAKQYVKKDYPDHYKELRDLVLHMTLIRQTQNCEGLLTLAIKEGFYIPPSRISLSQIPDLLEMVAKYDELKKRKTAQAIGSKGPPKKKYKPNIMRTRNDVQIDLDTINKIHEELTDNELVLPGDWDVEGINRLLLPVNDPPGSDEQWLDREGRIERLKEEFRLAWRGTGSWRKGLVTMLKICHPDVRDFETKYEEAFDVKAFFDESDDESDADEVDEDTDDDEIREESVHDNKVAAHPTDDPDNTGDV
jgi:hypothetical protein